MSNFNLFKVCRGSSIDTIRSNYIVDIIINTTQEIRHPILLQSIFQEVSVLDYTKTYDIIQTTTNTAANCNITLLWVHGGGASRALFKPHAKELASKGYRSILIDSPGHGSLVDTPLTLDSCVETVRDVLDKECGDSSKDVCYIGASLGAYIGFHILSKLQNKFTSSILLDCGQNVGPDCSYKARFGLWFLRKLSSSMNNKTLLGAMLSQSKTADYHIRECSFGSGMFFQQGAAQCDCLHSVSPADLIPTLNIPILYFNGSEDHRDSENKWLELCKDERSELKVYKGGDHFFCHDSRFVDDMLERMHKFIQAV